jgi:DNA transformation protein
MAPSKARFKPISSASNGRRALREHRCLVLGGHLGGELRHNPLSGRPNIARQFFCVSAFGASFESVHIKQRPARDTTIGLVGRMNGTGRAPDERHAWKSSIVTLISEPSVSFPLSERKVLLGVKGVGPTVVARLEQLAFSSLAQLARAEPKEIVEGAAALVGSSCWKNSPQAMAAIQAAIAAAKMHCQSAASSSSREPFCANENAISELERLANLGPKSAALLAAAGVQSFSHLQQLGAVAAYALAKRSGTNVSLNLLWALEGALSGLSWQTVAREHRASLLLALETHENGGGRS